MLLYRFLLGLIFVRQDNAADAAAAFQRAVQQQRYQDAVEAFEATIQARLDFLQAHSNVAMCYEFYLDDTIKALGHYRQYVALGGNDARAWQSLQATKQE